MSGVYQIGNQSVEINLRERVESDWIYPALSFQDSPRLIPFRGVLILQSDLYILVVSAVFCLLIVQKDYLLLTLKSCYVYSNIPDS